ncbi:MAG TPA: hypothetical protein VML50_01890 [Anaeromyxobacter sp.]|nr:hypothetical protein [Anaeromyxobacter sp.]
MRALLLAAWLLVAPALALGAHPVEIQEAHVQRLLLVSGVSWDGRWAPDFPTLGLVYQVSVTTTGVRGEAGGGQQIAAPSLFLHASAVGGGNLFADPHAVAFGALGLVSREQWPAVTTAGFVLVGAIPQDRLGPALRLELWDVVGLQAGVLFHAGRPTAFLSLDLLYGLLRDVGLLPAG